mmetsp:Transcript_140730/g.245131  ORF Transcript_140730/g.245131 Transcript_140730/m.245131 type:complete len:400 (-) Transcript_140730:1771-2970(-)
MGGSGRYTGVGPSPSAMRATSASSAITRQACSSSCWTGTRTSIWSAKRLTKIEVFFPGIRSMISTPVKLVLSTSSGPRSLFIISCLNACAWGLLSIPVGRILTSRVGLCPSLPFSGSRLEVRGRISSSGSCGMQSSGMLASPMSSGFAGFLNTCATHAPFSKFSRVMCHSKASFQSGVVVSFWIPLIVSCVPCPTVIRTKKSAGPPQPAASPRTTISNFSCSRGSGSPILTRGPGVGAAAGAGDGRRPKSSAVNCIWISPPWGSLTQTCSGFCCSRDSNPTHVCPRLFSERASQHCSPKTCASLSATSKVKVSSQFGLALSLTTLVAISVSCCLLLTQRRTCASGLGPAMFPGGKSRASMTRTLRRPAVLPLQAWSSSHFFRCSPFCAVVKRPNPIGVR